VVAAERFLRLAVRAVRDAPLAVLRSNHAPGVVGEAFGSLGERLLRPRAVLLDGFLHVARADVLPGGRVSVEQQHEFRHRSFSLSDASVSRVLRTRDEWRRPASTFELESCRSWTYGPIPPTVSQGGCGRRRADRQATGGAGRRGAAGAGSHRFIHG